MVRTVEVKIRTYVFLLFLSFPIQIVSGMYAHQPFKWSITQVEKSRELQTQILPGAPSFNVRLSSLIPINIGQRDIDHNPFYMCPSSNPGKSFCNQPGHFYCAYWGCETIASNWKPLKRDAHITANWGPTGCALPTYDWRGEPSIEKGKDMCGFVNITIIDPEDSGWSLGRTWGIRFWESGTDRGGLITIKKEIVQNSESVGPNEIEIELQKSSTNPIVPTLGMPVNPLWDIMQASFKALNKTNSNLTADCWLCYDAQPPFYEAIGINNTYNATNVTHPPECNWKQTAARITMRQVTGQGKCIGKPNKRLQKLCTETEMPNANWVVPQSGGWWVCSETGITPCVSKKVSDLSKEMCIQVDIIPKILYHTGSEVLDHWEHDLIRSKREPLTAITLAALFGLGAAGTGTGIASLIRQGQGFIELRAAVDEDLARLEKSINFLEKSVSSLSEVVLQNRRGLDLLFLQQGGLCAALGEECCFYADHTGVVRDSLAKVREGLEKRKKERESQQGLFESWYNYSPWLTTLISTLAGPTLILFLALLIGPCIINRIVAFVQNRVEAVKLMVVKQKCESIDENSMGEQSSSLEIAKEAVFRFDQQIYDEDRRGELL